MSGFDSVKGVCSCDDDLDQSAVPPDLWPKITATSSSQLFGFTHGS